MNRVVANANINRGVHERSAGAPSCHPMMKPRCRARSLGNAAGNWLNAWILTEWETALDCWPSFFVFVSAGI